MPQPVGTLVVFLVTTLTLSLVVPSVLSELINPVLFERGEIANYTIRAPRDFHIENRVSTEKKRAEVRAGVKRVFVSSYGGPRELVERLESFFAKLEDNEALKDAEDPERQLKARAQFERENSIDLQGTEWDILLDPASWAPLEKEVVRIADPILKRGVIANKRPLKTVFENGYGAVLINSKSSTERELSSPSSMFNPFEAKEVAEASMPGLGLQKGKGFNSVVHKLVMLQIHPNVLFDSVETDRRLQDAADNVESVVYRIKRGEVIVRAGDKITDAQERRLQQLHGDKHPGNLLATWAGYFILSGLVLFSAYVFVVEFWPQYVAKTKDLAVVAIVLIGSFVMIKLYSILATSLANSFYYFDPSTFILAAPVAAGGILLQVTLGASAVFLFMMCFLLLTGVFLENSWIVLAMIAIGNTIGAVSVKSAARRSAFIWAGARVATANMIIVVCFMLLFSDFSNAEKASRILWAVIGGLFSGVLGAGLTPIAEYFGRYITDFKLLELASLDHPLLRELSVQAPGTWNHSTVLGQMAEVAAEAIGANALLTRVGAYYHDIGKAKKPAYFVENQTKENRHDKLTPSMSALIIKKHVKEGIDMAKKYNLPPQIIDFIAEHHGTSLIEYFYVKAHKDLEEGEVVDESHYRYAGPKPQSKESGILMLADCVEASSRTLADPTPAKIQGLVQRIINKVFASGELDQSNLTLRDLHLVAKTFTRTLTGIYHRRVEYSEPAEKGKAKAEDSGDQKAGEKAKTKGQDKSSSKTEKGQGGASKEEAREGKGEKKDGSRNAAEGEGGKKNGENSSRKSDSSDSKETLKRLGM